MLSSRLPLAILCTGLFAGWLLPYHTYPYWSFYHDYASLLAVVLAVLTFYGRAGSGDAVLPPAIWLPVALAGVIGVQALSGMMVAPWDAVLPIGYLLVAAAAIVFGANLDTNLRSDAYAWLAVSLAAGGLASALITFLQYLNLDGVLGAWTVGIDNDGVHGVRPYANLGQPNQLALLLCWSIAATWWLFRKAKLGGVASFTMTVVLLASVALTQSKIAWMILPAFLASIVWYNRRVDSRRVPNAVLLASTILFVGFVLLLPELAQWTGTPTDTVGTRMETNRFRLTIMRQAISIALEHPLFGVGWSNFGAAQVQVAPHFAESQYAMNAHDIVANLAAETGWPVTIAVVLAIAYWLRGRFVRRRKGDDDVFALMIFAAAGLHSLVEFPLWYAYILMPIAFVVGLVESEARGGVARRMHRTTLVGLGLVASLSMVVVAGDYRRLVQSFRALGFEKAGLEYTDGSTDRPAWTVFPHFYEYIAFADTRPTIDFTSEQIAGAERVAARFGYTPVLMRLATIYALNGRPDDAVRTMEALRNLYRPRYAEAYAAWSVMATEAPELLGKVYRRLPQP